MAKTLSQMSDAELDDLLDYSGPQYLKAATPQAVAPRQTERDDRRMALGRLSDFLHQRHWETYQASVERYDFRKKALMMVAGVAAVGAAAGVVAGAPVVVIAGATLASYSCVGAAGVSKLLEMQAENTRSITRDEWREKFAAYVARQGANKLLRKFAAKIGYQPQPAPKITNKLSERAAYARDVEPVAKDHTIEPHSHVPAATHELLEERLVSNISPQTNVSTTPTREPQDSVMPRPRMK